MVIIEPKSFQNPVKLAGIIKLGESGYIVDASIKVSANGKKAVVVTESKEQAVALTKIIDAKALLTSTARPAADPGRVFALSQTPRKGLKNLYAVRITHPKQKLAGRQSRYHCFQCTMPKQR